MSAFTGAVIGCGRMGAFTSEAVRRFAPPAWLPLSHCEAMSGHPEISLVAICDVDGRAVERAHSAYPTAKTYLSYQQLIDDVEPQILGVATRTPERFDILHYAIEHGVRGLHLEKPLCNSVSQLKRIQAEFANTALVCTYGAIRRYLPVYQHARELVRSGRYGSLQQIQVCLGAGSLFWTHPHAVDMLLFMADDARPERVCARFATAGLAIEGVRIDADPVLLNALIEFPNGVTGVIAQAGGSDVVLSCSNGSIIVEADGHWLRCRASDGGDPYWRDTSDRWAPEQTQTAPFAGTGLALDRIVRGLRQEVADQVAADKRAMIFGQQLLFACAQSHLRAGAVVDFDDLDPQLTITGRSGERFA